MWTITTSLFQHRSSGGKRSARNRLSTKKRQQGLRRGSLLVEPLEDRIAPSINFTTGDSFYGFSTGSASLSNQNVSLIVWNGTKEQVQNAGLHQLTPTQIERKPLPIPFFLGLLFWMKKHQPLSFWGYFG